RGGKGSGEFHAINEAFQYKILRDHLTDAVLKDHFKEVGEPVRTLQDEVKRVQKTVFDDLAKAAKDYADTGKNEADKRQKIDDLLMPMCRTTDQVERLEKKLRDLPAKDVDALLQDVAERRILVDILTPLEVIRGAMIKDGVEPKGGRKRVEDFRFKKDDLDNARILDHVADLDLVTLQMLRDLLTRRVQSVLDPKYDPAIHFGPDWQDQPIDLVDRRKAIGV